jgi:hypothetical protein
LESIQWRRIFAKIFIKNSTVSMKLPSSLQSWF